MPQNMDSSLIGFNDIRRIKDAEELANTLGFKFASAHYLNGISLQPIDDSLPLYARDASLFAGSLADIRAFTEGVAWAKSYYTMLNLINDGKISRKEQDVRNKQLVKVIKEA